LAEETTTTTTTTTNKKTRITHLLAPQAELDSAVYELLCSEGLYDYGSTYMFLVTLAGHGQAFLGWEKWVNVR